MHVGTDKISSFGEKSVPETSVVPSPAPAAAQAPTLKALSSPAKGILLTPGTGAARRKTVTFGKLSDPLQDLVDGSVRTGEGSTEDLDSLDTKMPRSHQKGHRREAGIRRNLFEVSKRPTEVKITTQRALHIESKGLQKEQSNERKETEDSHEFTTDLKHPLSRSGQHWKREYHRDHETSKREMRKLIRYTQVAKSYAVKKDAEALELGEKLKHAQLRVTEMEGRVSALAAQLVKDGGSDKCLFPDQVNILNELAAQTAQALRYKQRAEKYKLAIQEHNAASIAGVEEPKGKHSQESDQVLNDSLLSQQAQQAQPQDVYLLQEEISILRSASKAAESKAAVLERENLSLKHILARVKQEMKGYEARHLAREERRRRKDEKAEAQKQLLKKELAFYKLGQQTPNLEAVSAIDGQVLGALEKSRTLKPHAEVENLNLQYRKREPAQDSEQSHLNLERFTNAPKSEDHDGLKKPCAHPQPDTLPHILSSSLHESIDIWTIAAPDDKDTKPNITDFNAEPQKLSLQDRVTSPLAELRQESCGSQSNCITGPPFGEPNIVLSDKGVSNHALFGAEQNPHNGSNAPTIASFALQLGTYPAYSRSNTLSRLPTSSRASSMSGRPPLPPDRIEAAKRRLEQRNAEKLKGAFDGKENRTP